MTSDDAEERDLKAAEYVLGTLDDREAFERALATDPDLQARVAAWETRLSGLAGAVPPVAPPPDVWARIASEVDAIRPGIATPAPVTLAVAAAPLVTVVRLRRSLRRWRVFGSAALATAAALVGLLLATARMPPASPASLLLAVLQPAGTGPAWLVQAQLGDSARIVPVNGPAPPAGRAFELWAIPAPSAAPISLGLLPSAGAGIVRLPEPVAARLSGGVTLAVSVEPPGGSPTGAPTGPVVYSGSLVSVPERL